MKFKIASLLLALGLLGSAVPASATYWGTFSGTGNCEGFVLTGFVDFRYPQFRTSADIDYLVTLSQAGSPVESYSGVVTVTIDAPNLNVVGLWGQELCGDYTVAGTVHIRTPDNDTRSFTQDFTCDCPDEDACHYTPGYWKNHPESWTVAGVTLGGVAYTQSEAIAIMNTPVDGDVTIILAYHLIAAKLNVAAGASHSIDDAIARADAYLVAHPLFSRPAKAVKAEGTQIKDELVGYNEMGCPDGTASLVGAFESLTEQVPTAEESGTWGAVKDMYR